jgi:hypothetical protein
MSMPAKKKPADNDQAIFDIEAMFADREPVRKEFLKKTKWDDAEINTLGEDCAFRRYYRLNHNGATVLLLDSIKEMEDKVAPSHILSDVVWMSPLLAEAGLHVPQVLAFDEGRNMALIEDFGDLSFNGALKEGADEVKLYEEAVDVLRLIAKDEKLSNLKLESYHNTLIHENRVDLVNWYYPAAIYEKPSQEVVDSYLAAWDEIEQSLPECPTTFLHCDFHVDNLMIAPDATGVQRIGVLDYQGAVIGPQPYDLANLLEDARKTLPEGLKADLKDRYCAEMSKDEREVFDAWYRVLATQFHCRVIGLFVRLLVRDNKDMHFGHIPRLQKYIADALEDPVLKPLKKWFDAQGLDMTEPLPALDLEKIRSILGLKA